jgi:ABC-type uncharacterized transport system involved in gliding motility auxiliary subunit
MRTRQQDNITLSRATVGLIFGLIGLIGLIGAVVSFAWYVAFNSVVFGALVVGLAGLVGWVLVAPQAFIRTMTGRQARYGTSATVATMLLIGVVTLSYILAARANVALDVTASGSFTLSEASLEVIERIPPNRTAHIVGFYGADALALRERDTQFLQRYETAGDGRIVVKYVDPAQNSALVEYFAVDTTVRGATVLYLTDENDEIIRETITYVTREDKQERYITGAMNRMLNERVYKVYFDVSRSNLSPLEEDQQGLTLIDNNLRRNGIQTDTLNILDITEAGGDIPFDAAVLVLARPLLPYLELEVAVIDAYLQRGGSLLILADATFTNRFFLEEGGPFNTYLFENYGIRALEAVTVDPVSNVQTPLDLVGYAVFDTPPIGETLPDEPTFFRLARAIEISDQKPATVGNGRIIAQSEQSYAERDVARVAETNTFEFNEGIDQPGPIDVAVWAWDEGGNNSKVVLIGDGDFAMNGVINTGIVGNEALFVQSLRWLSGVENEITFGFAANPSARPTIFVSSNQLDLVGLLTLAVVPLFVLLSGVVVWYRRSFG